MKKSLVLPILFFYLLPIIAWIYFSYLLTPISFSWQVTFSGIALSCLGGALLATFVASKLNKKMVTPVAKATLPVKETPPLIKQEPNKELLNSIEEHKKEIAELKKVPLLLKEEIENLKSSSQVLLEENEALKKRLNTLSDEEAIKLQNALHKIEELESENLQKEMAKDQLENQIHDLRYEIKTLLQLAEVDYNRPPSHLKKMEQKVSPLSFNEIETTPISYQTGDVSTLDEAKVLLQKCLQITNNLSGGYRSSALPPQDLYALDLRRLFDELKNESGALIVVYSQKQEKLLYASKESKTLLGISPEKLILDFDTLAEDKLSLWNLSVNKLKTENEVSLSLTLTTSKGEKKHLDALLGTVTSGSFRSVVIGVIFPAVLFDFKMN